MLLVAFTIAFLLIGIVLYSFVSRRFYSAEIVGMLTISIACLVLVFEIVTMLVANMGVSGKIASYEQRYESLVFQLENNLYDNDNDLGKKELYNQIQSWNENLASGKAMQDDIWLGVFWPDIYDDFEFIEVERMWGEVEGGDG